MRRRNFIKNSAATGLGMTTLGMVGCTPKPGQEISADTPPAFVLEEVTINQLQADMASGKRSSKEITKLYLDRIAAIDLAGPALNSVIQVNPDALEIAIALDAERKAGKLRGPLHGIPVLIKDNIDTADKMETTAGALALAGNKAQKDAFIAEKLRKAGAVILGKTNLSEWANFRSTSSCSGWSSRGGQTRSPYLLSHNPCGSSSGSGVAVAANLCAVAIGTETDGSITCPASVNGIVGIKPTVGLWSRSGIIPISATQDTAGPMARTVADAAILLGALVGVDPADSVTQGQQGKAPSDYTSALNKAGLQGKRIGVDLKKKSKFYQLSGLLDKALEQLRQQGATVVDVSYVDAIDQLGGYELTILQYEFKDGVNKYLGNARAPMKNLDEVIAFNKANEAKAMPYFKQEQLEQCASKGDLNAKDFKEALTKGRDAARDILLKAMQEHRLDAFCGLTMGPACAIDMLYGDRYSGDFLTQPAAMSGFPHVSLPCGLMHELPVGLSFFAEPYSEAKLIAMAYAFEQSGTGRPKPTFKTLAKQAAT